MSLCESSLSTEQQLNLLRILRNLERTHNSIKNKILDAVGLDDGHFWDIVDCVRDDLVDAGRLEECGCCDQVHPEYAGDCRNDDERF